MLLQDSGDATSRYIVIVPLKYDVHTVTTIELASFNDFEEHHTMFLKKSRRILGVGYPEFANRTKNESLIGECQDKREQMRARRRIDAAEQGGITSHARRIGKEKKSE